MSNIPKVIHYCWFGNKKKPKIVRECIESWRINLPDYDVIEWNENNFKFEEFEFTKEAYLNKKWAFVADYCRIWVLYNYGGVYLDTDMEVVKNFDIILNQKSFLGVEGNGEINGAIWGCSKEDPFTKIVLDYYDTLKFEEIKNKLVNFTIPKILTKVGKEEGFINGQEIEHIHETTIYPKEYFYPKYYCWEQAIITNKTYTIHHCEGSWKSKTIILIDKIKKVLIDIFGYDRFYSHNKSIKGQVEKK